MATRTDADLHKLVALKDQATIPLGGTEGRPSTHHVFEEADIRALRVAFAAGRPLLLRGEPGVGKSQLARAAAHVLGWRFVSQTIDARTESRDLLYRYDAVRRLAAAQLAHAGGIEVRHLAEENFIQPGKLWFAFSWDDAEQQAARARRELMAEKVAEHEVKASKATRGAASAPPPSPPEAAVAPVPGGVILIDEIAKADSSVPNGLLEALGDRRFEVPGLPHPISVTGPDPFVVITSNRERTLPPAFLRRCMVHEMRPAEDMQRWFFKRGRAHFSKSELADRVLKEAARLLAEDRVAVEQAGQSPPGQAEYLDLLRALHRLAPGDTRRQKALLKDLSSYAFQKHTKRGAQR